MDTPALRQRMAQRLADESAKRTFTLDASFVPEAKALLSVMPPEQDKSILVLREARLGAGAASASVVGKATLLGIPDVNVTLTAGGDDKNTWLVLAITSGLPDPWTLSPAIQNIPDYWSLSEPDDFGLDLQPSFLKNLPIAAPRIVFSTHEDASAKLRVGLNLSGAVPIDKVCGGGLFASVLQWIEVGAPLSLSGTLAWPDGHKPVIDLRAPLGVLKPFQIGSFRSGDAYLRMRTDSLTLGTATDPVSLLELAVPTSLGQPTPLQLTVSTEITAGGNQFLFRGESENESFSLGHVITDISLALGLDKSVGAMPEWFPAVSALYLRDIELGFAAHPGPPVPSPTGVAIVLALPDDKDWPTPIPNVAVSAFTFRGSYLFGEAADPWHIRLDATLKLGEKKLPVHLGAQFPELLFVGELAPDSGDILVNDALSKFLDASSLPDIGISAIAVSLDAHARTFDLLGSLVSTWKFPLGEITDFGIEQIEVTIHGGVGTAPSGTLHGVARLGTATFEATLAVPAVDFTFSGKIASIQLGELITDLCHDVIPGMGTELDFQLTNCEVAITKSGSDYLFFLRTSVAKLGTLFFEIQRNAGKWGAAVGVDLSDLHAISDIPGLSSLHIVDLHLDRMIFVLSSIELKGGYTFPDLPAIAGPPAKSRVTIPKAFGTSAGLNVFAKFMFGRPAATTSQELLKFYKRFRIEAVEVDVGLQLGRKNNGFTVLLGGACDFRIGDFDITGLLAFRYADVPELLIRVTLEMPAPHGKPGEKLTFGGQFELEENGIEVSASMSGKWTDAFGIEGFTVTEAGVAVGIDWELLPTIGIAGAFTAGTVDGSIGFVINTVEPLQSGVFGSLSDTSLKELFMALVGSKVQEFRSAMDLIGSVPDVTIGGISAFDLDAGFASAFDDADLKRLAPAFRQNKEVLGETGDLTFVVTAKAGQKWYITDVANDQMHWEIERVGGKLQVSREAQFYLVPVTTNIGTIPLKSDFRVFGQLSLFGWKSRTVVHIQQGSGIWIDAQIDPLDLGFLKITRSNADQSGGGPYLALSTFTQGANPPRFAISCDMVLVGIPLFDILVKISSEGLTYHLELPRSIGFINLNQLDLTMKPSPMYVKGGGKLVVGIGGLDLGALGHIPGILALDGTLRIGMNGAQVFATLALSFELFGLTIPVTTIDLMRHDLSNAAGAPHPAAAEFAKTVVANEPAAWLKLVNAGRITTSRGTRHTPAEVGRILRETYRSTPEEVGELVRAHMKYDENDLKAAVDAAAADTLS
jgi:hypothetical protein